MSSQYKENNFSTESVSSSNDETQNNINTTIRPDINYLIKRIHIQRRRERRNVIALIFFILSVVLIFVNFF